jgi:preprotein translocase subunit SecE
MKKITQFFKEVKVELSKVTWPTRRQAIILTSTVIAFSIALALFISFWDWIFTRAVQFLAGKLG